MKKYVLNKYKNVLTKQYPNYDNDKIDEIMYGVEGIYILITKCIIIFSIAFILGILKDLLILLLTYNFIRLFAFGMHASKSHVCLISSSLLFLGGTYICKIIIIPKTILIILYTLVLIIMFLYAPADTVKRPLIKKKKRIRFKILSITVTLCYLIISLIIKNNFLINSMIIGLIIECILILPITYKIFKMPYKNYLNYGLNAK